MNRLSFLFALGAAAAYAQTNPPATGRAVPELLPYENALRAIMRKYNVPGAALAIADGNRLVYARGIGFADREAELPVQPTSAFRLASISKTFTGMTIMKLVEEGKLNLDARVMDLLPDLTPSPTTFDARMRQVTVRQLLRHTGGFDRAIENDHPQFYTTASRLFGNATVTTDLMARYILSQRLDFDPGTKYVYGNSGYQLLGRVIERVSGQTYEAAVRERVHTPAGATGFRLGRLRPEGRYPDEVKYYDYPGAPLATSTPVPGMTPPCARPYCASRIDLADAFGGWVGNTVDLLRYALALDGKRGTALLSAASITAINQRPAPPWPTTGNYVGLAWRITPTTAGNNWWHSGGAAGTRNLMLKRAAGRTWVVLTNTRPLDEDGIIDDLFADFLTADQQIRTWPTHDLFPEFSALALRTSAETLTFEHTVASKAPAAQTLEVTATGGTANFAIAAPTAAWLKVDGLTGVTPGRAMVSVDPAGLAPGVYEAPLDLTVPNSAAAPRQVRVTLRVLAAPGFSTIRNAASFVETAETAPESRLVLEAPELDAESVRVGETAATIVASAVGRVDFVVPKETPQGEAVLTVVTREGRGWQGRVMVGAIAPALFAAAGDGKGAARARVRRTAEDGTVTEAPAYVCEAGVCVVTPIDLGPETDKVELVLDATGVRSVTDPAAFTVKLGDEPVETVGITAGENGVDLIAVRLPRTLAGRGELDVVVTVADKASNAVRVAVQ